MVEQRRWRGRTEAWRPAVAPGTAAGATPVWAWPAGLTTAARGAAHLIREWLSLETAAGRLVPWLAIAFGFGIILYFSIDQEPAPWAAVLLMAATAGVSGMLRRRSIGFPIAVGLAAIAAGFGCATIKCSIIAHSVLTTSAWNVEIAGFVEAREERERSDRITLRVERITGTRLKENLERVRLAVRKGRAPKVGSFVEFKARLSPPMGPLRPGGYDFARDMYFSRIGASGFVLGNIRIAPPPAAPTIALRYAIAIDSMREAIDKRIRAVLPGDRGSIASALITGKRDAISAQVNEAMYVSGLAHVLSISGYHMAVVASIAFFAIRALFALLPGFANCYPIKKWAAFIALLAAAFYLLLSGAEVATQRSFIMIGIVLIGVLVDRATLTFRTLTVAALCVLLLAPEAVVHPSFQMSFAATLALVAGYQLGVPWMSRGGETPFAARIALWGGRELLGLTLVSLLAGTATIPYIAYHFHRVSPYGVVANLAAMPVVSAWVMPWGIFGLVAMPLGLDGSCWSLMGLGIDWMVKVALWTTTLPGALGRTTAFTGGTLLFCSLGLVMLCLLKTPLRLIGAALIGAAVIMMIKAPQPDVLVAADGSAVAIRGSDGRLAMIKLGSDTFAFREWLAADGDSRSPQDGTLAAGIKCDHAGCIGVLKEGALVAFAKTIRALEEDCRRAAIVISARDIPGECGAVVLDRQALRSSGATALRRVSDGQFEITTARPRGYNRPWAGARLEGSDPAFTVPPRDATPRTEDLELGD